MKITAKNVSKLKYEDKLKLLNDIVAGGVEYDKVNQNEEGHSFIQSIVCALVETLDELDCDDAFGTEGWRHTILGED